MKHLKQYEEFTLNEGTRIYSEIKDYLMELAKKHDLLFAKPNTYDNLIKLINVDKKTLPQKGLMCTDDMNDVERIYVLSKDANLGEILLKEFDINKCQVAKSLSSFPKKLENDVFIFVFIPYDKKKEDSKPNDSWETESTT